MAVPYLLSGMFFSFFFEVSSGDEKGIDFYQRGCLRLWCFQSSVLEVAKKYIIARSSCLRQWRYGVFSEEVWSSSGRKKQVDRCCRYSRKKFSQRLGKNKSIFSLSSKADRHFQNGREKHHYEFFFQMCRSCSPSSLIRHSQSSRWFFSVVLLEDVIVEDWGGFTNSFPREGPGNRYCDQILTIGVEKMLERRRRSSSSGWDVVAALLHSGVSWVSYPDGVE